CRAGPRSRSRSSRWRNAGPQVPSSQLAAGQERSMAEAYKNLVGGKWVDAASGRTFEDRNPADRHDLIGTFPRSDAKDVAAAVAAAKAAFETWRKVPAPRRGEILFRAAEIMVKRKEELARLMVREM